MIIMKHPISRALLVIATCALSASCDRGNGRPDTSGATKTTPRACPDLDTTSSKGKPVTTTYPITHEAVTFTAAGMTVHGTLTRPVCAGTVASALIIAGSGPTDRDWNSPLLPGTNGSAKLLAQGLAQAGVATLRYDKRGTGETGVPKSLTWDDYTEEQQAALKLLAAHAATDPRAVFVAGHSEGGAHALRLASAANTPPLAGVILLSTAGRSFRDVILWQIDNQLRGAGLTDAQVKAHHDQLAAALDRLALGATVDPTTASAYPGVQNLVKALQDPASVAFTRALLAFDPLATLTALPHPALVLSGDRDLQIDPALDARALDAAARHSTRSSTGRSATLHILAGADHVLKHEPTPRAKLSPAAALAYNAEGRALHPELVSTLATWMQAHRPR